MPPAQNPSQWEREAAVRRAYSIPCSFHSMLDSTVPDCSFQGAATLGYDHGWSQPAEWNSWVPEQFLAHQPVLQGIPIAGPPPRKGKRKNGNSKPAVDSPTAEDLAKRRRADNAAASRQKYENLQTYAAARVAELRRKISDLILSGIAKGTFKSTDKHEDTQMRHRSSPVHI